MEGLFNFLDALLIVLMLSDAICALANVFIFGIDDGGASALSAVRWELELIDAVAQPWALGQWGPVP